jgi:putative DNA primase/helicase
MTPRLPSQLDWAKTISILEVARKLGLEMVANSARCWRKANHAHGDRSTSLGLDVAKNRYKCFVCDPRSGSTVDLVMAVLRLSLSEALEWFQRNFDMPDHIGQGSCSADFDPRKVSLSTIIRSGLWAGLTDSQKNILAVLWDGRDDAGKVTASYSQILRHSGLASRKTVAAVIRAFEEFQLLEILRRDRATSTYHFLENEKFLRLQRESHESCRHKNYLLQPDETKGLVPPEGTRLCDEANDLVPVGGTRSEERFTENCEGNLVPSEGPGSLPPLHTGFSSPRRNQISDFSEREQQILRLARRGFQLFPCKPRRKDPAIVNWRKLATADPQRLVRWFADFPEANWAVVAGPVSRLFVVDVDAEESWSELCQRNCGNVKTLGVRTSRGRQLYFRYPTGSSIRNSASRVAAGIDVRGQGGYALCPPSIHPNGTAYEWLGSEDQSITEAPAWLLQLIQHTSSDGGNGTAVPTTRPSAGPIPPVEGLRLLPCYVHRGKTPHWKRGEDWLCGVCTPNPAEVRVQ